MTPHPSLEPAGTPCPPGPSVRPPCLSVQAPTPVHMPLPCPASNPELTLSALWVNPKVLGNPAWPGFTACHPAPAPGPALAEDCHPAAPGHGGPCSCKPYPGRGRSVCRRYTPCRAGGAGGVQPRLLLSSERSETFVCFRGFVCFGFLVFTEVTAYLADFGFCFRKGKWHKKGTGIPPISSGVCLLGCCHSTARLLPPFWVAQPGSRSRPCTSQTPRRCAKVSGLGRVGGLSRQSWLERGREDPGCPAPAPLPWEAGSWALAVGPSEEPSRPTFGPPGSVLGPMQCLTSTQHVPGSESLGPPLPPTRVPCEGWADTTLFQGGGIEQWVTW